MYFFAEHPDEPHKEYAGQWRNDTFFGVGKRLSKDGTLYVGHWKRGTRLVRALFKFLLCPLLSSPSLLASLLENVINFANWISSLQIRHSHEYCAPGEKQASDMVTASDE
jgi:hypothetical protein